MPTKPLVAPTGLAAHIPTIMQGPHTLTPKAEVLTDIVTATQFSCTRLPISRHSKTGNAGTAKNPQAAGP
ncbi:MAG: hypothetical protein M3O46_10655, partial [Myxococcota bacterium]|nr:hypothetical protein [Myxococcota bacterium]